MRVFSLTYLALVATLLLVAPSVASVEFSRTTDEIAPGESEITLELTFDENGICQAVEEQLPQGLLPMDGSISDSGYFVSENNALRWGPFITPVTTTLTYRVSGLAGDHTVAGAVWVDGSETIALTGTVVSVTSKNPSGATEPPPQVAMPQLTPSKATELPVAVEITCATDGAQLRYTLDGTLPHSGSALYTEPLQIVSDTTLRACAFKEGYTPSRTAIGYYVESSSIPTVEFSRTYDEVAPGESEVTLELTFAETGICQAVEEQLPQGLLPIEGSISDNGHFVSESNVLRWGPFITPITTTLTYRVCGLAGDYTITGTVWVDGSEAISLTGTVVSVTSKTPSGATELPPQVAMPQLTPSNATELPVEVEITCATDGAQLRYTLDGTVPSSGSALYTEPLQISSDTTVRVRAFKEGYTPSRVVLGYYHAAQVQGSNCVTFVRSTDIPGGGVPLIKVTATVSGSDVLSYAIVEEVEMTLRPFNISDGGAWNSDTHTIKWGPFDDGQNRSVTYQLYSTLGATGIHPLDGVAGVNGLPAEIHGADSVELATGPGWAFNPTPTDTSTDVPRALQLAWDNPPQAVCNALYCSTNRSAVEAMDPDALICYDGSTLWSSYKDRTALKANQNYYWQVVEFDQFGVASSGVIWLFTTRASGSSDFMFYEDFEHGGALPSGWSQEYVSGSQNWICRSGGGGYPAGAHGGSYNATFFGNRNSRTRLITPMINIAKGSALSFWHVQKAWSSYQDKLYVYYRTSVGGAWTLLASYTTNTLDWTERLITLPDINKCQIAFEGASLEAYGVCIDDVMINAIFAALGTPISWLNQYDLTNDGEFTYNEAELLDSDGDGIPNWQEYVMDTDPTDPDNVLRIEEIDIGPPATVSFSPASPDRDYTLQTTDDLADGEWRDVVGPYAGREALDTMTDDDDPTPNRLYRIKVEVP